MTITQQQIQIFVENIPNETFIKIFIEYRCYRSLLKFPVRHHTFAEMKQAVENYINVFGVSVTDKRDPRKKYLENCVISKNYIKLEDFFSRKDQFVDEPLMHMLNQGKADVP